MSSALSRRRFVSALAASTAAVAACRKGGDEAGEGGAEDEVTPAEDLMREHGVLRRIMYVYDEAAAQLAAGGAVPLDALGKAAALVQRFVHGYHERMEEQHVFPRFEAAHELADLTAVLRVQHEAGRVLTARIRALAAATLTDPQRAELAAALRKFDHTYRAHAAREDTVLFPRIRGLVGAKAYAELGEEMEDIERREVGEGGFEAAVAEISGIERTFGVADLATL